MARNAVQFQKGLSFAEFMQRYGTEEQCHAALIAMRWPDGFRCPKCGGAKHSFAVARRIFQCSACRVQTSVRAGTVFHKSSTPLTKWFLAMHLMTSAKNDISGLELARQLGVKWDTAWLMKQKLMEVMRQRNTIYKLSGDVQIDDAYLGGEKPGKTGRGAANKTPFVIAVATRNGKPVYTQLRRLKAFTKTAIREYAAANIEAGSWVVSDGLRCFLGLAEAGMRHIACATGGGRPKNPLFKWVNTGLGNVKSAITGTCRSFDPQHADRYLAAFEWRFNRRFSLGKNIERLARVAARTAPQPYNSIASIRPQAEMAG
ncbi:MAG: ribosomal protein L37AE/L43A/transposase-like protein [Hyphomicrobiaceae bacterium]|jgi:ribosomal protein L37AE/L43A/transposase-like protein